jgi:hypothetical protein
MAELKKACKHVCPYFRKEKKKTQLEQKRAEQNSNEFTKNEIRSLYVDAVNITFFNNQPTNSLLKEEGTESP